MAQTDVTAEAEEALEAGGHGRLLLARGFGMSETIRVTADGHERLTRFPRQLFVTAK